MIVDFSHRVSCSCWMKDGRACKHCGFPFLQMCSFAEAITEKWFWETSGSWICKLSSGSGSQLPCRNQCIFTVLLSHQ